MKKVIKWLLRYRDEYTKSFSIGYLLAVQIFSKLSISNGRMTLANLKYVTKKYGPMSFIDQISRRDVYNLSKSGSKCWAMHQMSLLQCSSFQIFWHVVLFLSKILSNDYLFDYFVLKTNYCPMKFFSLFWSRVKLGS
jgi:hypothetical protein